MAVKQARSFCSSIWPDLGLFEINEICGNSWPLRIGPIDVGKTLQRASMERNFPQMPFMAWNDRLSVNIVEIDKDHQKMLSLINQLYDAIQIGQGTKSIMEIQEELVSYSKCHFAREEEMMVYTGYDEAASHKLQHEGFTREVMKMQNRYGSGSPVLSIEVMVFLKDWFFDHLMGSDARYASHLNAHGIH